jgi:RES domain-containing protein
MAAAAAVVVQQMVAWDREEGATRSTVGKRLAHAAVVPPRGCSYWTGCTVRAILQDPTDTGVGVAYGNRSRSVPATGRRSPLLPVGAGKSYVLQPPEEWVAVAVPPMVSAEECALVQQQLAHHQQTALRTTHYAASLPAARPRQVWPVPSDRQGTRDAAGHARRRRASSSLSVAAGPTGGATVRGSAARAAPFPPVSWTRWSGQTWARC